MKLYQLADGSYVGTQAEARASKQTFIVDEVPTDKDGLIHVLNQLVARRQTEERLDAKSAGTYDGHGDYQSPLSARSTLAGIDAIMCSQAIEQMSGEQLAVVMSAGIKRLDKLTKGLAPALSLLD